MITISLTALLAFNPCDPKARVALFNGHSELNVADALAAGATLRDVLWVLGKLKRKDICVKFAIATAKRVVHLAKSPKAQAAIDAAQAWIDNPCEKTRDSAADAAAHAAHAAYAAYAADAAAHAAYAAAYAAYAADAAAHAAHAADAAYAADAAAYAAYAADAAADAAAYAAYARKEENQAQRELLIKLCDED